MACGRAAGSEKLIDNFSEVLSSIILESFKEEMLGFFIRDFFQHTQTCRIIRIVQNAVGIVGQPCFVEADEIPHQADVNEIDRLSHSIAQVEYLSVLFL